MLSIGEELICWIVNVSTKCCEVTTISIGEKPVFVCYVYVECCGVATCVHVKRLSHQ